MSNVTIQEVAERAGVSIGTDSESVAQVALDTYRLNPAAKPIDQVLLDRHFLRKHGDGACYGQDGEGQSRG